MKKLFALLLALAMVLSLGAAAAASEDFYEEYLEEDLETTDPITLSTSGQTVTISFPEECPFFTDFVQLSNVNARLRYDQSMGRGRAYLRLVNKSDPATFIQETVDSNVRLLEKDASEGESFQAAEPVTETINGMEVTWSKIVVEKEGLFGPNWELDYYAAAEAGPLLMTTEIVYITADENIAMDDTIVATIFGHININGAAPEAGAETTETAEPADTDGPAYLLGGMDLDSRTYTNEDFAMSAAFEPGWLYAGPESLASYYGWTEADGVSAAEYLKQLIDGGDRTAILSAQSEDGSYILQLDVFAHEGVGGYTSGGSPLGDYMHEMLFGGDGYMESMGMPNCQYTLGTITIRDHDYETIHFEYDMANEAGETVRAYEDWLCLLHRDEAADCDYVMTICMTSVGKKDIATLASMLTLPPEN